MRDYMREQEMLMELSRCADLESGATVGELRDAELAVATYCLAHTLIFDWHDGEPCIMAIEQTKGYEDALIHRCQWLHDALMEAIKNSEGKRD